MDTFNFPTLSRVLATIALTGALASCATSIITPEQETSAGYAMQQQVADQIGLYHDPELGRYLDAVGQRLAAALGPTPYSFQFAIVDQFEPNAFASPGGFIYVSRGLLAQMNSEAELAGVLAHEISHVTQRHHTKQAGRGLGAGLLTLPGLAIGVVSEDLGNMINTPINYAGKVYLSSYSRGQETEADEYGIQLTAKAGYDPLALVDALQGIERTVYLLTGKHHEASFFDSHPTTPQRVSDIQALSGQVSIAPVQPLANTAELYGHLDGLWWGPENPQAGIFNKQTFRSADMDFSVTFPEGWKTMNTPRFVGASEPGEGAYLALGSNSGEFSPKAYGAALVTRMRERTRLEPAISRASSIGDWPAYIVRYDDTSGEEVVSLFYVFVDAPNGSYTFMGMGLEHFREDLRKSVMSLAPLDHQGRESIQGIRLRTATLRQGESLQSWSKRLGSQWGPVFSASMNSLDDEHHKGHGELLKYAHKEQYRPQ